MKKKTTENVSTKQAMRHGPKKNSFNFAVEPDKVEYSIGVDKESPV